MAALDVIANVQNLVKQSYPQTAGVAKSLFPAMGLSMDP